MEQTPPPEPDTTLEYITVAGAIIGAALGGIGGLALGAGLVWLFGDE